MTEWLNNFVKTNESNNIEPLKVLFDFDGPRTFTVKQNECLFLAHQIDENNESLLFILVPFTDSLVSDLESHKITLLEALDKNESKIVNVDWNWEILDAWKVSFAEIPQEYLPKPGIMLWK